MYKTLFLFLGALIGALAHGQNPQLARNYFEQGRYGQAAITYEGLLKKQPEDASLAISLVEAYQQLETYDKARDLLLAQIKSNPVDPTFYVELGHNYELQGMLDQANAAYDQAQKPLIDTPSLAFIVGRTFEKYALLDRALSTYETAIKDGGDLNFKIQIARIYGEQGNVERMLDSYIDIIASEESFYSSAERNFSDFITEDPQNEANILFRKLLLNRSQQDPQLIYNRLLSWLFVQQNEYDKAFAQEKAIYRRSQGDIQPMISLAGTALSVNDPETTPAILVFIIAETTNEGIKLSAEQKLLELRVNTATAEKYMDIKKSFTQLLTTYGNTAQTVSLQIDFAHFLAFYMQERTEASQILKKSLDLPLTRFQEAEVKMELADILVLEEKFGSALIYYTQIQKKLENNVIAQEARFKVAKTSYYKGDFEWAQVQLKVLKSSTTQLIANDAQELYLLIADNSLEDSTQTALKLFARSDLLAFQNKTPEAIALYNTILTQHKGECVEDEALLAQAKLYELEKNFALAEANYLKVLQFYKDDILADDALYRLAELYAGPLQQPEKAKEYYEQVIFDHADSIYYTDAQKKFRVLRGDVLNQ